jgi:hypothetical protein
MTVCRLTEYRSPIPEERGLLVLIGPAWLCAMAYEWTLRQNPVPKAIAIAGLSDSAATIAHTFDNKLFPFGEKVKID